jgi:hypothetical protein
MVAELPVEVPDEAAMAQIAIGHCEGLKTVELVALLLGFGPREKRLSGHCFPQGDLHGAGIARMARAGSPKTLLRPLPPL